MENKVSGIFKECRKGSAVYSFAGPTKGVGGVPREQVESRHSKRSASIGRSLV